MKNIILIGAQGAGKGTYAQILKNDLNIPHISTGDMFREAIKAETPVGIEAKNYIDQGQLVPDTVTIKLVDERLARDDCKDGFMLDGFPRTLAQAEALDKITDITHVIILDVREDVVLQRLGGRIQCRNCGFIFHKTNLPPKVEGVCDKCSGELYTREDDQPEAIKKRLAIFYEQSGPLVDFYDKKGIVHHADANNPVPREVADDILKLIRTE
ncbi:adenylate kinase [Candidatus Woesearchaeota archaeon]|nr:adenylate kinase [Candidatus Woesearchaeota archaeon]